MYASILPKSRLNSEIQRSCLAFSNYYDIKYSQLDSKNVDELDTIVFKCPHYLKTIRPSLPSSPYSYTRFHLKTL